MTQAMTVLGPVPVSELGRIMPHEHLLSLTPGPWQVGGHGSEAAAVNAVDLAVDALSRLPELGFFTVVDLSPYGVVGRDAQGNNAALLREISRRSGLHIISGTALYLESYSPGWAREASLGELVTRLVRDATEGIGSSGVRAGVFGEQATGLDVISAHEEKCLRAIARAHRETGLSIMTHTTHGSMALEQIALLRAEGVDLDRVVIGHLDTQLDPDLPRRILDTGARIAIDTIGKQDWDFFLGPAPEGERGEGEYPKRAFHRSDRGRADLVAALAAEGLAGRILLAQDLTGAEVWLNPDTHGQHGYSYLGEVFVPMLVERGVSEANLELLLATGPGEVMGL
ncbi:phosphotriesterase [Mycetocola sp. JXN-3]|uniref:phosphotriesterase family protein n=1 Tax=Mycetocola sp. JXN-3 TaxID=2116510 RepID=UPI00165D2256|nr:aryldialkylphosphatase [Mycetocola sp. JXN-3]